MSRRLLGGFVLLVAVTCTREPPKVIGPIPDGSVSLRDGGTFVCQTLQSRACDGDTLLTCAPLGEFYATQRTDCSAETKLCDATLGCIVCVPGTRGCVGDSTATCKADGSGWDLIERCDALAGIACERGACLSLCEVAKQQRSYRGCEFWAADLDNAAIGPGLDASSQQFAVVVSNPNRLSTEVWIERNDAPQGMPTRVAEVSRVSVPPGDLHVFKLPRRELDGSSSNIPCTSSAMCPGAEVCHRDRKCRVSMESSGRNDGTHTALSSQGYRVNSRHPVVAYQFNPLDNVEVFSNDASLLIPTSSIGTGAVNYHVLSWPQTIADSPNPEMDHDPRRNDEDLRAFLTIVGTQAETTVNITLGREAFRILGAGTVPERGPGDLLTVTLGPFDVLNLETQAFGGDFSGSFISATKPVVTFVGTEASDVPRFPRVTERQCCADHLEEQLFPESTLGKRFVVGRAPRRTAMLNRAFTNPDVDRVSNVNEPEWIRILATAEARTEVRTTLPAPDDIIRLTKGAYVTLRADQDFYIESNQPIVVLQVEGSQQALGIPEIYPGGDPSIIFVPPIEQWRVDYTLLVPEYYAFDFIVFAAEYETDIMLDRRSVREFCESSAGDGIVRRPEDDPPTHLIWRCQLGFPDVIGQPNVRVEPGDQDDGVHDIIATRPISVMVGGFDEFVSYAYAGGLDFKSIN